MADDLEVTERIRMVIEHLYDDGACVHRNTDSHGNYVVTVRGTRGAPSIIRYSSYPSARAELFAVDGNGSVLRLPDGDTYLDDVEQVWQEVVAWFPDAEM